MMQTKFSILLGLLVGFTSFSSPLFAQTACFGYDSGASAPDGFQLEVEEFATFDGTESSPALAALAGSTTYRIYLKTNSPLDYVSKVYTDGVAGEVQLTTSTSFYMNEFGGLTVNDINPGLFSFFPALEYDSYVTIGLDSEAQSGESSVALSGSESWGPSFLAGNNLSIDASNSAAGSGWSVPAGATNSYAGADGRVMIAQVTTDGALNGSFFIEFYDEGANLTSSHQFSFSDELCGCTDATATNYQPAATLDDGSCTYPGCTDASACNYDAEANDDDGSCDYCCDAVESSNPDYGVEVELHAVGGITGLKTYRLYVTTANPTDAVSAVTGYAAFPMNLATTTDFYQYLGPGGGVTPNAWNSAFGVIPEFAAGAYDSFVTIGITQAPDAGAGEGSVQTVETPGETWQADFEAGSDISISTSSGGGWFLSPGSTNGIAGDDNRVLIGQFTTDGFLSGDLYVQIFPEGDQTQSQEVYISWTSPLCACTDEAACNYDPVALWDDGSCQDGPAYWGENLDCDGNCLNDADGDYVCDENEIEGCLNPAACNYVAAPTDLVACIFPEEGYDCDGNCLNDVDGDGVCDEDEVEACTDATACNYNDDPTADSDNALCVYPDPFEDCDGNCLNDSDGDGVCDELEIAGCTDASACNYDATATDEDGNCDYCCAAAASVEGYNIIIEALEETPQGTRQRMYIETPNTTDVLSAVTGDVINPTYIRSTQPFYQSPLISGVTPNGISPAFFAIFPELAYDSWVTIGVENNLLSPTESAVQVVPATTGWEGVFNSGGDIEMEGPFGDGWFVVWDETAGTYTNGLSGDDNRILVGQFTTNGILSGELFVQMFPEGDQQNPIQVHLPFGYASEDNVAPVFTSVPADVTQSCSDAWPTEMATAEDEGCIPEVTVTVEETVEDAACGYLLTRTFTATDAFGNSATATQLVNLEDTEAPVAVAQEDLTVQCSDDLTPGAGIAEEPTSSYDNCADDLTFSYVDAPYTPGFDLTGATADFHVEMGKDFGGPFGQSYILEATGVTIGAGPEITLADETSNPSNHRGAINVDIDGSSINMYVDGTLGTPYQYDYAIVTISNLSVDDLAGISVVANGIAPGAELTATANGNSITVTWDGTATYADGDAADFTLDNVSTCLAEAGIMRTWTVTDGCNNSDTAVQYFTIVDTEGPEFTSTPANLELSCNDEIPMGSVAADDCGAVSISEPADDIQPGTCGNSYTIFRTWTATDECGNSSEHTQTIMIVDNEAPVFTSFPEDVTYTYGDDMEVIEPTASDDCNDVTISYSDSQDNSNIEITVITRTWTATDACGNSVSADQIITVNEVLGCTDDIACNYDAGASYDDGSCDYCSCGSGGEAGFGLELELVTNHDGSNPDLPAGLNTYRVYVTTPSADDFVSSVSGDVNVPAYLNTTTSFYQHPFGAITPANINPAFFAVVPSLMYDSWLTIGIESQATGDQSGITVVEAPGDTWQSEFNAGGNLTIDSFFGGSWFALITASNGYAGEDQRVLVAQLTTSGEVTGQLYVQVFPNGDQSQDTYLTLGFGGNECGCTDATACNYDAGATYDDGSCAYPELGYDCAGECVSDTDGDGVCDELEIYGCTTEGNCNYDPEATEHDESMCQVSPFCIGCNDETACNYNPNVIPEPNFNDGSCEYPEEGFDCDGNCDDENGDLICDILQGCDDPMACTYEPGVEFPSDDFCEYCSCENIESSVEGYGIEIEELPTDVEGAIRYQVYVTTPSSSDVVNAILGNALNPIVLASSSEIYQNDAGSAMPSPMSLFAMFPLLESDSYVTLGAETPADAMSFPPTASGNEPAWVTEFENGGNIEITDAVGSGWYMNADMMGQYGVAGDDNRVLVAQLTTPGTIHGMLYVQIFPDGLSAGNTLYVNLSFGSPSCGCTDPMACNYDEGNMTDDGSCYYANEGESCEGTCLYDATNPEVIAMEASYTTTCEEAETDVREPVFADNCDDMVTVNYSDVVFTGDCQGEWTIQRTWTAEDNNGNVTTVEQVVNVVDTTAPTFTVPADASISCTSDASDLNATGDVTDAVDGCSEFVEVTYSDSYSTAGCFANNVITRTWTATDDCGNSSSQDQTITLVDDNAPYFTSVPEGLTLSCGDEIPAVNATAADACSDVTVTYSDAEGDMTCTGLNEIIRTFEAMDACGNSAFATQTITFTDTEAPMGSVENVTLDCGAYDASAEFGSYSVEDNCSAEVTVSWVELGGAETSSLEYDEDESGDLSSDASNPTVLGTLPLGTTTIAGSMANFQSVNSDPEYFTIEVAEGQVISSIVLAEFTHNGFPTEGGGGFIGIGEGTSLPVLSSMEDFPAATAALFGGALVGVMPGTAPGDEILDDLEAPFEFMGLEIAGFEGGVSNGTYTMMFKEGLETAGPDAYTDYTLIITVEEEQAGCFEVVREYTFTDGCGNSSTAIQTITVEDNEAPTFEAVAAEVELQCGDDMPAAPAAMDNCSAVSVTYADVETGLSCSGEMSFIRTYTATDACGNESSVSVQVTYNDTVAPTFTVPAHVTIECDSDVNDLSLTGDVNDAADVCSSNIDVSYSDAYSTSEGSCLENNIITRTWTVTDGCGNMASGTQVIELEDTTPPVVNYEANVVLENEATSELDDFEGVEVADACSDWTYTTSDTWVGNSLTGYELHRVMVFTDACGNSTTIEQNITAIYSTGCTYMDAENYDPSAIVDDGSCEYAGCTDMASANYNPLATIDDGSCVIVGCMDPDGYDYNPDANYPG
ncbi:MAG: hypothetical protein ACO2XQ_03360, partial [Flavobacteriales bacterium]